MEKRSLLDQALDSSRLVVPVYTLSDGNLVILSPETEQMVREMPYRALIRHH